MATTLSRNLKLRIDSNLTSNAKYNLEKIDLLGSTFLVDTSDNLNLRSTADITIQPHSADLGGSGVGGTVTIGSASQPLDEFVVYADSMSFGNGVSLEDQASGGTKKLNLKYKSDINGSVDTVADRNVYIDVDGSDRNLVLGANLSVVGVGSLVLNTTAASSVTLPLTGVLSTLAGAEVLTNKTIDASLNTITGLVNANISNSAAIAYSKLALSGAILNSDISGSAAIAYSKLALAGSLVNSDISASAAIAYSKLALSNSVTNADIAANAAISGSKIDPDFGNQIIRTAERLRFSEGGYNTDIRGAQSGQTVSWILTLPDSPPQAGEVLAAINGSGDTEWVAVGGTGTVTSVDLTAPSDILAVSGNPVTTAGTLVLTKQPQSANTVWAGPTSGGSAQPTFRALVAADMPAGLVTGVTDTASVDLTVTGTTLSADVLPGGVDHDALLNFVAAEHVNHTSVNINTAANSGLSGGGDISASRSLTVDPSNATSTTVASGDLILVADVSAANALRQVTAQSIADLAVPSVSSFKVNWTSGTTFTATHNLGSRDVIVQIYDNTTYETIEVDSVVRTDTNNVDLTASSAPTGAGWRVQILAV